MSLLRNAGAMAGFVGLALALAAAPTAAAGPDLGAGYCSRPETVLMLDGSISVDPVTLQAEIDAARASAEQLLNCPQPPRVSLAAFNHGPTTVVPLAADITRQLKELRTQLPEGWSDPLRAVEALRRRLPEAGIIVIMDPYVEPGPRDGPPVDAAAYARRLAQLGEQAPLSVWTVSTPATPAFASVWAAIEAEGIGGIVPKGGFAAFRIEPAPPASATSGIAAFSIPAAAEPFVPDFYDPSGLADWSITGAGPALEVYQEADGSTLPYFVVSAAAVTLALAVLGLRRSSDHGNAALPDPPEVLQMRSKGRVSSDVLKVGESRELTGDDGSRVIVRNTDAGLVASTGSRSMTIDRTTVAIPVKGVALRSRKPGDRLYESWADRALTTSLQQDESSGLYWPSK